MRFGIRSKDAVAVTLLTFLVVATTTMVHISQLTRVVVQVEGEVRRHAAAPSTCQHVIPL